MYNTSGFGGFGIKEKYMRSRSHETLARKERWEDRNSCSSRVPLRSSRALAVGRVPPLYKQE